MNITPEKEPTIICGCAIAIAKALEHKGVDSREVFHNAGIDRPLRNDPMDRLPYSTVTKLYELSVEATDPYFGLTVARFMQVSNIHALGYSLLSSSTLLDFCQRLTRYLGLISPLVNYFVEEKEDEICLIGDQVNMVCHESQDGFLSFVVHFMRQIYEPEFAPLHVEMFRPEPHLGSAPYVEFFNAPVSFDCEKIALHFDKAAMLAPLNGASPELAQFNDSITVDYLAQLEQEDIIYQVEAILFKDISSGLVTREQVAKQLHMSTSALKLKLAQKGTNFQKVLDQVRQDLSQRYMNRSGISISEIGDLLGFTDISSFSRTFKRWTGQSPRQYRIAMKNSELTI